MQLYHGQPSSAGHAEEIAPSLAPYPILMRVRYFAETDEPLPAPSVTRPVLETPNYLDENSPPPVRTPRAETAPVAVEEPKHEAVLESASPAVKPEPPAKPTPWTRPPELRTRPSPRTRGKLVAFLLLLVIVGLCVHWHALSLVPEYPDKLLSSLRSSDTPEEMLVVPADGAPMLVAVPLPEAPPTLPMMPTAEKPTPRELAVESELPSLTPAVTGWPVEPPPMPATVPIEAAVAKPVESVAPRGLGRPLFVGLAPKPAEGTIVSPALFEQPATAETNMKEPVEAEFGPDILPSEEGGTP